MIIQCAIRLFPYMDLDGTQEALGHVETLIAGRAGMLRKCRSRHKGRRIRKE